MKWTPIFCGRKIARAGFSLAEFVIVLGVMGVVIGSIWGLARQQTKITQYTQFGEELSTSVTNFRGAMMGSHINGQVGIPLTLSKAYLLWDHISNWNIFPAEYLKTGLVKTPWPDAGTNPVTINDVTHTHQLYFCGWNAATSMNCNSMEAAGATNDAGLFAAEVVLYDLETCSQVIVRNTGTSIPGLVDVVINGTWKASANGGLPVTFPNASTQCATASLPYATLVYRLNP